VNATWFYIVGVINTDDSNQVARIMSAAVEAVAKTDGRVFVLGSQAQCEELSTADAADAAVNALTRVLDYTYDPRWRGWVTALRDQAQRDAEAAGVEVHVKGEECEDLDGNEARLIRDDWRDRPFDVLFPRKVQQA
jgi:hypothetical protein